MAAFASFSLFEEIVEVDVVVLVFKKVIGGGACIWDAGRVGVLAENSDLLSLGV